MGYRGRRHLIEEELGELKKLLQPVKGVSPGGLLDRREWFLNSSVVLSIKSLFFKLIDAQFPLSKVTQFGKGGTLVYQGFS